MNNIAETIRVLQSNDFYGESESIEIAKGKFEKVYTWKDAFKKIKRIWKSRTIKK